MKWHAKFKSSISDYMEFNLLD